jgi:hypothetical protein
MEQNLPDWKVTMKDAYEVLRQKEMEVARVKQEIAALLLIVPLLNEDNAVPSSSSPRTQPDSQVLRR